jgi:hypothetical protein
VLALNTNFKALPALAILLLLSGEASAHEGMHHGEIPHKKEVIKDDSRITFERINTEYNKAVKPIFEVKCFACHAQGVATPWYGEVPLVKNLIRSDMVEAKEHMDMTKGFPFGGHGTPLEDLEAIQNTLAKGEMPPLRYRLIHWSSSVSENELQIVKSWIQHGIQELKQNNEVRQKDK